MKYTLLITVCLLLYGSDSFSKNTIAWESEKKEVKTKASGLFSKKRIAKFNNSKGAPIGSYAKTLAVDNYKFQWQPRWNFVGLGGALLPFVLQSIDQSTLGIVETLPQKNAEISSIIVFINLYTMKVVNYMLMTGKDVREFCYVPFSSNVVCLIKYPFNKYSPKAKFQLQTMDTHIDLPVSTSTIIRNEPTTLCCSSDGSKLFVGFKNSNRIKIYNTEELTDKPISLKTVKNPIAIKRSKDGKKLVIAGSEQIQIFDTEEQIIPEETINLPKFFTPDKIILCSDDASSFIVSNYGGATYFYHDENFTKITKRTDADVKWDPVGQNILISLPQKKTIAILNKSDLENPKAEFRYKRMRPATNGKLYKIIKLPASGAGIAVLDKRGSLYRLYKKRQRWYKEIIINQPKPQ